MKIYLVGGAIRDALLGRAVTEQDWVVVGATPQALLTLGYRSVGKEFPVFLHPETQEEYALARVERKTAPGYHGFDFVFDSTVTLEEDLSRRDLTINAMAQNVETQEIIDPYGGLQDLNKKLLRHVTEAFQEDPVRILRVARFAARYHALGFTVAPETMQLMTKMVEAGEANALIPERVWKETARALLEPNPHVYLQVLRACGALKIIFPEIDALYGVPQPPKHHPEVDCGIHAELVLQQAAILSQELPVRFAALCHDLGKAKTPQDILPSHHGHEMRSKRLTLQLCQRLKVPNELRDIAVYVAEYHGLAHSAFSLKPTTILKLFEAGDCFRQPKKLEWFLLACDADSKGRTGFEQRPYVQVDYLRKLFQAAQSISAQEVIAKLPSPSTGPKIKEAIQKARIYAIQQVKADENAADPKQ
jgi:tRNA nucleotidyltransferase (CCA-adding enzyme)